MAFNALIHKHRYVWVNVLTDFESLDWYSMCCVLRGGSGRTADSFTATCLSLLWSL